MINFKSDKIVLVFLLAIASVGMSCARAMDRHGDGIAIVKPFPMKAPFPAPSIKLPTGPIDQAFGVRICRIIDLDVMEAQRQGLKIEDIREVLIALKCGNIVVGMIFYNLHDNSFRVERREAMGENVISLGKLTVGTISPGAVVDYFNDPTRADAIRKMQAGRLPN